MRNRYRIAWVILLIATLTACQAGALPASETALVEETVPAELLEPGKCLGDTEQSVAESIAETFEVSYDQVMVWFCNGAEYEDILLALQTADSLDVSADELLKMRAAGLTWEDIWTTSGWVEKPE